MKTTIQSIRFSFNTIEVSLLGLDHTYFISPNDVEWFSIDENNRSMQHSLGVGTSIQFEIKCSKTRNLKNVKIQL